MPKLIKACLWLAGLLAIALIGAVVTLTTLDPNDYKDWLVNKVQQETGRHLTLTGDLGITFYPWLGLKARDLRLGQAEGFGDTAFVRMDYVNFRIKTLPLLQGQYEIDTVNIQGAELNLAKNSQGVSNWDDLLAAEPTSEQSAPLPLTALALGGVNIENAVITWRDEQTDTQAKIQALNIKTAELKYGEPIDLAMRFHALSNRPALDTEVTLQGVFHYDTDSGQYSLAPLNIFSVVRGENIPNGEARATLDTGIVINRDDDTAEVTELKLTVLDSMIMASLTASDISTTRPKVTLTLSVAGGDLASFFKVWEIEPLASQIATLKERRFDVNMALAADGGRGDITLSTLQATLLGASIDGELTARHVRSDKPEYRGRLTATGPDLPTLMQVLGQLQGGKDSALSRYGRKLAHVQGKAFVLETEFDADIASGTVTVPTLAVDALGVAVRGELHGSNLQDKDGSLTGSLQIRAEKLAGVLRAVEQEALAEIVQSVNFNTRLSGNARRVTLVPLTMQAVLAGKNIPGSPVTVALSAASSSISLHSERLTLTAFELNDMALSGLGLNLSGRISASNMDKAVQLEGELELAEMNLRQLARQLHQPLPVMADNTTLQKVALSSRFSGNPRALSLPHLLLQVDETTLQGKVSATADEAGSGTYAFDLAIDAIDLDRYLPPRTSDGVPAGKPAVADGADAGDAGRVAVLRQLDMAGDVTINRLKLANVRLANVVLAVAADGGVMQLNPIAADLYQGKYRGDVMIDAAKKLPHLTVNSTLSGVNAKSLLDDAIGSVNLQGTGNLNLALAATGLNAPAIKRTLNGTASLRLQEGLFVGVDIGQILKQVEIMLESKRFGRIDKGRQTPFDSLTGSFDINAGIISNRDLLMQGNGFKVTGKGILANLVTGDWDYDLTLAVAEGRATRGQETYNLGGYDLPVTCRGRLQDTNCKLDIARIAEAALKKTIIDKILPSGKEDEGQGFDPAKELLKKIF